MFFSAVSCADTGDVETTYPPETTAVPEPETVEVDLIERALELGKFDNKLKSMNGKYIGYGVKIDFTAKEGEIPVIPVWNEAKKLYFGE